MSNKHVRLQGTYAEQRNCDACFQVIQWMESMSIVIFFPEYFMNHPHYYTSIKFAKKSTSNA